MTAPEPPATPGPAISKPALWAMLIVLAGMLLVALHMNYVRLQRDKVEKVIVTPVAPPAPSPAATP